MGDGRILRMIAMATSVCERFRFVAALLNMARVFVSIDECDFGRSQHAMPSIMRVSRRRKYSFVFHHCTCPRCHR